MKKWKCTVCGYIHEGNEPPEKCPVCKADKSKFIEMTSDESVPEAYPEKKETGAADRDRQASVSFFKENMLFDLMVKHHIHPISVHVPNGVLPVSIIFVVLAALFNFSGLSQAAFYNLIFVVLSMPLVLFSGFIEWQNKYNGSLTKLFLAKIICSVIVTITAIILALWLFIDPDVVITPSPGKFYFLLVNLVMLGGVSTAGFLGGKLVFKD